MAAENRVQDSERGDKGLETGCIPQRQAASDPCPPTAPYFLTAHSALVSMNSFQSMNPLMKLVLLVCDSLEDTLYLNGNTIKNVIL